MKNKVFEDNLKDSYVLEFCLKQGFKDGSWICDGKLKTVMCDDFIFDIKDIFTDLVEKAKKGLIIEWFHFSIENEISYLEYVKNQQ
jgi:hypothetical protein